MKCNFNWNKHWWIGIFPQPMAGGWNKAQTEKQNLFGQLTHWNHVCWWKRHWFRLKPPRYYGKLIRIWRKIPWNWVKLRVILSRRCDPAIVHRLSADFVYVAVQHWKEKKRNENMRIKWNCFGLYDAIINKILYSILIIIEFYLIDDDGRAATNDDPFEAFRIVFVVAW